MANLALENNNPGNLTVNYQGQILYPGQTGTMTSRNGFTYATFPDAQTGFAALVDYIKRHVANGVSTVGGLLNLFGAPSGGANSANPNPNAYTSNFDNYTGLAPNSSILGIDPNVLAGGIATAEGAGSLIPGPLRRPRPGKPGAAHRST